MGKNFTINILGTEYNVEIAPNVKYDRFQSANGWCDLYSKSIVCLDAETDTDDGGYGPSANRVTEREVRHEIIHAFMYESGLDVATNFARNEMLIDFLALQIPKMAEVMKKCGAL